MGNDLDLNLGAKEMVLHNRYEILSILNDVLIALWFIVKSVLFFSESISPRQEPGYFSPDPLNRRSVLVDQADPKHPHPERHQNGRNSTIFDSRRAPTCQRPRPGRGNPGRAHLLVGAKG